MLLAIILVAVSFSFGLFFLLKQFVIYNKSQKPVPPSKSFIKIDSKIGTYIFKQGDNRYDIGDYLEVKFNGKFDYEEIKDPIRNWTLFKYEIEIHFSATHNEENVLITNFVCCSSFVNEYIKCLLPNIIGKIIPMSTAKIIVPGWSWFWPKIDGESIGVRV